MFSIRHKPEDNLYAHLVFSLKYEGVNLWILNALFKKIPQTELEEMIQLELAGAYSRRIWFLYEWLTGADLADKKIRFVDVLDDKQQYIGPKIVIADFRYTHLGYRNQGGFIGEHERGTNYPIPDHISARFQDVGDLMEGLIETDNLLTSSNYNSVLAAAAIAFGLVFIHPYEDGNGRIHRYLIHHVLIEKGFTPVGVVFPVSYVILERIKEYRAVLESYSSPRLDYIKWRATESGNVEVLNETKDLYRYFDATKQAEFLFLCIQETIEEVLPKEIDYLKKYDEIKNFIDGYLDMPARFVHLLIQFLQQEKGRLSKRAREKEFNKLTQEEISAIESKFQSIFYNKDEY
ncbi:Fic family protein [Candidatus Berkiella cookevillensis]|uniref:Fic family protein n=1 Tax=Candidatus Berkiella cookevillensis TaxID=437022 RepID=A0A0Q9YQ42_9GAMM|nr:Fic family protein [Candidatus Berkiella cookevillensis]MCS5708646.1 Fic family protein [Candidatus Berkiella cookevillensis]